MAIATGKVRRGNQVTLTLVGELLLFFAKMHHKMHRLVAYTKIKKCSGIKNADFRPFGLSFNGIIDTYSNY